MPDDFLAGLDVDRIARRWAQLVTEYDDEARHLLAEVAGCVVGISTAGAARDDMPDGVGELYQINLHPDSWGHGFGTVLHDAQLQDAPRPVIMSEIMKLIHTDPTSYDS